MEYLKKYNIEFYDLEEGEHEFEFDIDDEFFNNIEYSEINKGRLKANILFKKTSLLMSFDIAIAGEVRVVCDRCTDEFDMPVEFNDSLIVKFGEENEDIDDNVIVVKNGASDINIAHYLYESINLSLPLKKVHPDDENGYSTCNQQMLDDIEDNSINSEERIDPRWDKLKELIDNKNNN
ncbi:MAG: DUF177 domain-containing protein [Bacteroidota bacterium]|nr:DUF177 domain-containing protein [Bacteroidota bacterium]